MIRLKSVQYRNPAVKRIYLMHSRIDFRSIKPLNEIDQTRFFNSRPNAVIQKRRFNLLNTRKRPRNIIRFSSEETRFYLTQIHYDINAVGNDEYSFVKQKK